MVASRLIHNGSAFDCGDDAARSSDDYGRFLFFESGGAWIHTGLHAYCVIKGWGVWLPPAVLSFAHPICESRVVEVEVSNDDAQGLPNELVVVRCSGMLCEMLRGMAGTTSSLKPSNPLKVLLASELKAGEKPLDVFVVPMPLKGSRIADSCEAILRGPDKTGHLARTASRTGLSVRTLSRLFSHELGASPAGWRRDVQIATAVGLLDNGMAVSEVARILGFRDSAFSTFFRARLGYSPRQRRRGRQERAGG